MALFGVPLFFVGLGMITPVLHSRVNGHMDKPNSARFSKARIDFALNVMQDKFINTFVDTFQLDQYTRDAMRPLVKNAASVTVANNVISFPADYRAMVGLTLTIDGNTKYWPREMLYSEKGPDFENSFTEPTSEYPQVLEDVSGLRVYCGSGTVSAATMDYIVQPQAILYSSIAISATSATALTVGVTYFVYSGTVTHNSVSYMANSEVPVTFVAVNTTLVVPVAGTVYAIQNCQLGPNCQEELCKTAAALLAGITEDQIRFQIKAMEGKR